jgi:molybdopterin-guanine dinucleotide biosynthesis protein B
MKVVGFAGFSGSGKTTLVEQLIPALKLRGLRVSVVKHAHHDFDIDHPGKDTYRHREAGAFEVVVASDRRLALMREFEQPARLTVHQLLAELYDGVDWVLVEGFKHSNLLKIEVWRAANGKPARYPDDDFVVAIATDSPDQLPQATLRPVLDLGDADSGGPVAGRHADRFHYDAENVRMTAARPPLKSLDEALAELLARARRIDGVETVSTFDADGRVLGRASWSRGCRCRRRTTLDGRLCGAQPRDRRRGRDIAGGPTYPGWQCCGTACAGSVRRASSPAHRFPKAPTPSSCRRTPRPPASSRCASCACRRRGNGSDAPGRMSVRRRGACRWVSGWVREPWA